MPRQDWNEIIAESYNHFETGHFRLRGAESWIPPSPEFPSPAFGRNMPSLLQIVLGSCSGVASIAAERIPQQSQ